MNKLLLLVINGLVALQLVQGQGAKTAWSANIGGGGGMMGNGAGGWQPPEPTEFQIQNAISQIYLANNEQEVINAGLSVFTPSRDLPDNVANAIEHRIAVLRTPAAWSFRLPPPLPSNFDAGRLVEAAYYGHNTAPFSAQPAALPPGALPGIAARRPGNLPRSRTRSSRFQARRPAPAQPQYPEWTPPANTMEGWINPFILLSQSWLNQATAGNQAQLPASTGNQAQRFGFAP